MAGGTDNWGYGHLLTETFRYITEFKRGQRWPELEALIDPDDTWAIQYADAVGMRPSLDEMQDTWGKKTNER